MKKTRVRWLHLVFLCVVAFLIVPGESLPARAESVSPADRLQQAWRNAQGAGSYRFISDIDQVLIPRPVPEMIGQQETTLNLAIDGAVVLPDQAYSEMRVVSGPRSESVVILRDGNQSFMLQDGDLKPVENALNLASQSNDLLGYLAAADQVTLLDPPEGHPELARYGFVINGLRYAEHVRQQAEAAVKDTPGSPQGLTLKPVPALQQLTGQGELWVNQAGLPVRQVLDLQMPQVNQQYGASIHMQVDLSNYGKVETLPKAVQGPDGTWQLSGTLAAAVRSNLGVFPGFNAQSSQSDPSRPAATATVTSWRTRLASMLPLRASPTSVVLFVIVLLAVLVIRTYRRNPRRLYALIVCVLVPILVFSPVLESAGAVRFMERQAQAAAAREASMPDLLRALGFDTQEVAVAGTSGESTSLEEVKTNNASPVSPIINPLRTDSSLAAHGVHQTSLQVNDERSQPSRCGEGEIGVDTDRDGLNDRVEFCLGTSPYSSDSDTDGIPDKVEVDGFVDEAGTHWDSDPLKPDSNGDGVPDTMEWSSTLAEKGQASSPDLDRDGTPNLWDDDDDGDAVPDAQDLSPSAVTGYTTVAALSTEGGQTNDYETIEIQVQPEEQEHLRYTTTALDWPADERGNIQDRDDWNSHEDLRLTPFLIVVTNVEPEGRLADKYGFRSWLNDEGEYVLMAPLSPVQESGAVNGFYAKIAYAGGQTTDVQWQAQMVWMAEMQADYAEGWVLKTETRTVHQYQDSFRITGLKVTRDRGYEAAVLGVPEPQDDLELFRVLLGLNDTFKTHITLEGQADGETALDEVTQRFGVGSTTPYPYNFGVQSSHVLVNGPILYESMDAAIAGIGSDLVPTFLQTYDMYYGNRRCNDADGNPVSCASLIVAYESSLGVRDLADLPVDTSGNVDLTRLHINLAEVPLLTTRGVQMRMYEAGENGWQMTTASRMLELIEQRYQGQYGTAMRQLYPDLEVSDVRFIAYAAYLWATSPSYTSITVDGQTLVDGLASETQLAIDRALDPDLEAGVQTAIDYFGMGTGIAAALAVGGSSYVGWALGDAMGLFTDWAKLATGVKAWNSVGVGLSAVTTGAAMILGIINAICSAGSQAPICRNADALKVANAVVQSLGIIGQVQATVDLIIKAVKGTLEPLAKLATGVMIVGLVIGIAMTWVSFALTLAFGGLSNPVLWRNALAEAIITTIYLIVMFIITCIPVIGQIIAAIMAILDGLFSLFTWLFIGKAETIATAILKLFYDAEVCTNVGDASFGEFSTSLADPELGLVDGNTLRVRAPFEGALYEEAYGNHDDLAMSSIEGRLTSEYSNYTPDELADLFPTQDMSQPSSCETYNTVKYCSNSAEIGYLLSPRINGLAPVKAVIDYTIIWAAMGGAGAWRWSTNTWDGMLPDLAENIRPEFMYLDVLPVDMTDLWTWSELTNRDPDGDGLTTEQETALRTTATSWDTDGDGLSDGYEWETSADYGADPLEADTDGDGLNDGLEMRLGTFAAVADSDGDGLSDGVEVRRNQGGAMVGGWQVSITDGGTFWVSADPLQADADGDGLNDAEEMANRLSPHAANPRVPALDLSVSPLRGVAGRRAGAYWQPGEEVGIEIWLSNGSANAVTDTLSLDLPDFLQYDEGGAMLGDRTPSMSTVSANGKVTQLSWSFSGAHTLQTYEAVHTTITAHTTSASGSGEVTLSMSSGGVQLRKAFSAVQDGDDPDVAILAPANDAYLRGTGYVVGGAATDPTTWVTGAELSINGGEFQTVSEESGAWAYSWNPPGDGVYTLQARATDVMGYTSTTEPVTVTVDNTPPTVVDLVSEMVHGTVHLSGTATDSTAGVAWIQLSLDGQPWRSIPLDGSAWAYDWTVGDSAQGEHQASVMAVDRSGNPSSVLTQTITVDRVAPSSTVNAGADPDVPPAVKPDTSFNITGVADEGGHLPLPAVPVDLRTGMDAFDDSAVWLGLSSIHDNDGGVLATWIGDFNADRRADLAVGLPGPEDSVGQVTVLYGRAGGWPTPPDLEMLATSQTRFRGASGVRLGSLLAAAGDTNGDNFSDLLIGERASTRAFLVFGKSGPLGEVSLEAGQTGYRVLLEAPASSTITGLGAAGDVDGDGYGDLLVHAGGTAYLLLGRPDPWPETVYLEDERVAAFDTVTGALGVGDVDNDQLAEWVTLSNGTIRLYGWNNARSEAESGATFTTSDADPRAVALGDVDEDGKSDWLYSNGSNRILVYGSGGTHPFTGYGGLFAAPGDVDGDGRADILLADTSGMAALIGQPAGSLAVFATIDSVGGAANAPYAAGADLNSDGSADLVLIPSQAAAEARGFDAPDFGSGFISPQSLPLGADITTLDYEDSPVEDRLWGSGFANSLDMEGFVILSSSDSDTRYVDDDPLCDGHSMCSRTIQAAVNAADGGGDRIVVLPGVYPAFNVPAGTNYDRLTVQGVSADAVFIDNGGSGNAIQVAADGVHLSNLTVRNAEKGIVLLDGAGEPPVSGGTETSIDHVVVHSVQKPIWMSQASALSLSDSTLVGDGSNPPLTVDPGTSSVHTWNNDAAVPLPIGEGGTLVSAGGSLYTLPGSGSAHIYRATPGSSGLLGSWSQPFDLKHALPPVSDPPIDNQGKNLLAGSSTALWQMHSSFQWPGFGSVASGNDPTNGGIIKAVAIHPTTNEIYVGGYFTSIGGVDAQHVARWNGTGWQRVGNPDNPADNGVDGPVFALDFVPVYVNNVISRYDLYIGGDFDHFSNAQSASNSAGNIVRWTGTAWLPLGQAGWSSSENRPNNGVNGPVNAIAHDLLGYDVFIGGSFTLGFNGGIAIALSNVARYEFTWANLWINPGNVNGPVTSLAFSGGHWHDGYLYVGGAFSQAGGVAANNVARWDYINSTSNSWAALGSGMAVGVKDMVVDAQGHLNVATVYNMAASKGVHEWTGGSWEYLPVTPSVDIEAVTADHEGNVYAAGDSGYMFVRYGASGTFAKIGISSPSGGVGWSYAVQDLALDRDGRLYAASGGYNYNTQTFHGALDRWTPGGFFRLTVSDGTWSPRSYPPLPTLQDIPAAIVSDGSDNLYAIWGSYSTGMLYSYDAASNTWSQMARPDTMLHLKHLAWANDKLYAAGTTSGGEWRLMSYDPTMNTWAQMANPPIPTGAAGSGLSWAWDGFGYIYMLRGDGTSGFSRYAISTNTWETLVAPTFTVSTGPAMVREGSYLYVYGTGSPNNLFRYGSLPASDLRLAVDRTAFVVPDPASPLAWTNLSPATGSYRFRTDIDTSNAWIGPSSASWSPALPTGAPRLTWAEAAFVAPEDGLYRLGAGSQLEAGYHHYMAVAHVYPSEAACAECASLSLTWGVNAFATVREAVESGAARILVHPGRYPQTFYLVSGIEIIGSGAESTIIEPPAGTASTLVTAEGVAGSSLARLTLAGGALWDGFLAEGGVSGLKLSRMILRGLKTGIRLRGGSEVEIVNNTLVGNADGIFIEDTSPVNVRNTIVAYNSGTGLRHADSPTSLSNTYNDFWSNGTHMNPERVSLGSLYVDPRFRNLDENDLRLREDSPLIDRGAPTDPTSPGGGERVDMGYAEFNAAGFYVSQGYSETGQNDGLTWGIDAFRTIQAALDAAAAALHGLQGALPEGGYSVAVDDGTYNEQVTVPSHVRLVGSGAGVTTIDAGAAGSAITFDGVIDGELSGFTVQNAGSSGAGVELKGAASGITLERNIIADNASHGISLSGQASAEVLFNTIINNRGAGVYATGTGTWTDARNNVLDGNATGLQAASNGLIRNRYNLLHNTADVDGVTMGDGTLREDPVFADTVLYVLSADSPALDAAEPWAEVPLAGGLRADLGYKELIASPLTLVFGPEIQSTVTGNTGVAKVEVGVVPVSDATLPLTDTVPTSWETLTPAQNGQPLYSWSQSVSLPDTGLYRVYSRATDEAGNTEADEDNWYEGSFVIDNVAPSVSWSTTLPGSTNAAAVLASADVTGTVPSEAGPRSDVALVNFNVDGPAGRTGYPAEAGQAWILLPATGSYTITATAVDQAGNQAQQSTSVTVSSSDSVATVTSLADGAAVSSTDVTVRGYVRFAAAGSGEVVLIVNDIPVKADLESPGAQFSAWSARITLPVGDGDKSISVAPSLGGVVGTITILHLTLDTAAPTLAVSSQATEKSSVTFTATAADAHLARVEVSIDGGYTWRQAVLQDSAWSLDWDLGLDQDHVSYPARVRAVDTAGNVTLAEHPVSVDTLPPTGLAPVRFSLPVGQHLDAGINNLEITWNTPVDAGGTTQVLLDVDTQADTLPESVRNGTRATASLNSAGDWYVHLMAQDAAGNQVLTHYGPWHVRDMANETFSARRESIVLDGYIDLTHDEWQATDLLGVDARSGNPQELYLSVDGEYVFMGWSGAWWTLDGVLWAYLDTAAEYGTGSGVDDMALPVGLANADKAVEIRAPGDGSLWTWNGDTWVKDEVDFANHSSGDTEVRIPWAPSTNHPLNLIAFALPSEVEDGLDLQALRRANKGVLAMAVGEAALQEEEPAGTPWAVFPTTNALSETLVQSFMWSSTALDNPEGINQDQPTARTVYMTVSSPQANGLVLGQGSSVDYEIELTNPEPTDITNLTIGITATTGLSSLTCPDCTAGESGWTLTVAKLEAGSTTSILVNGQLASDLSGLQTVTSTFELSAGTAALTPESQLEAAITHRVDGQAPGVTIDALPGSAIPAGNVTFTGTASDEAADGGASSGVATVEVLLDNGTWTKAQGTQAWSVTLDVSGEQAEHTLKVYAIDSLGNMGVETSHTFTVDTTNPDISWSETMPGVITANVAFLSGTTRDPAPTGALVERVEVQVDGAWKQAAGPYAPDDQGVQGWAWAWKTPLEDGVAHTLLARATDGVGLVTDTDEKTVIVDVVAPQLTVDQQMTTPLAIDPLDGSVLTGSVTDGSGVQEVVVWVSDPQGGISSKTAPVKDDHTWGYVPDMMGWVVGTYSLRVQARDIHGNLRMKGPYQLLVTETPVEGLAATNDGPHMINETVTFTATIRAGSNVRYTWDFGDGTTANGQVVTHAYAGPGSHTATVTAANLVSKLEASTTAAIWAMSMEAGADQAVVEGQPVTIHATFIDGRSSMTHSATIDWGDGTTTAGAVDETAKIVAGSRAYADNGAYTVTVTISDGSQTSSDTLQIAVSNVAPAATLVNDGPQPEGSPVSVSFSDVTEPGTADTLTYSFDWDNDGVYEIEDQSEPSAQHTWPDNAAYTVQAMVKDDDGGSNAYTTTVEVTNAVPAVEAGSDATIDEGGTFTSAGYFTDPGADTWTASVDYGDGSSAATLELTDKGFSLSHLYADNGDFEVQVCVVDDDGDMGCDTAQVTVNNVAPGVTADPVSQTVQYSEAVTEITFTATDVDRDTMSAVLSWSSDGTAFNTDLSFAGLALDDGSCSAADGTNTCIWKVTGNIGMPEGSYTLRLTVTDKDGGATDTDVSLTVQPEEASVAFDGSNPVAVQVASAGGDSGPFSLGVCVGEPDVPLPGDINLAEVSMRLVPIGPGGPVAGAMDISTVENGMKCVAFSFNEVPVNTYVVAVEVTGGYYAGASEDVLVVNDPSLGFTTGGGWFYWPGTANPETGYPGDRTNFGYTMKYNKKGTNIQGNLLMVRHLPDGTIYRVKSNALYGLALGEDAGVPLGWASFSGKSTYQEPGWPEPVGNYEFFVYVEDGNKPGTGVDRFWIEVLGGLALPAPAGDGAVPLEGGNLVVPHRGR